MEFELFAKGTDLVRKHDAFLFDADGVLWLGDCALEGAVQFLSYLVDHGKEVFILSNNSTKTTEEYVVKCERLGFDMISEKQIITPAKVVAHILSKEKSKLPVYLIGSAGLQKELLKEGIESFGIGPDHAENYTNGDFINQVDVTRQVRAVIVSYDVHINYVKIMKAINYLDQVGVRFFATNEDITFPGPVPGVRIPGSGLNVAAVRLTSEKEPIVTGKPSHLMYDYIRERFKIIPEKTLVVGDRCDTDIKFARRNGMNSLLVGTGIHSLADIVVYREESRWDLIPNYYSHSLKDLLSSLK